MQVLIKGKKKAFLGTSSSRKIPENEKTKQLDLDNQKKIDWPNILSTIGLNFLLKSNGKTQALDYETGQGQNPSKPFGKPKKC